MSKTINSGAINNSLNKVSNAIVSGVEVAKKIAENSNSNSVETVEMDFSGRHVTQTPGQNGDYFVTTDLGTDPTTGEKTQKIVHYDSNGEIIEEEMKKTVFIQDWADENSRVGHELIKDAVTYDKDGNVQKHIIGSNSLDGETGNRIESTLLYDGNGTLRDTTVTRYTEDGKHCTVNTNTYTETGNLQQIFTKETDGSSKSTYYYGNSVGDQVEITYRDVNGNVKQTNFGTITKASANGKVEEIQANRFEGTINSVK